MLRSAASPTLRAASPGALEADPHAFRVITARPEGRTTRGANPLVAAGMTGGLLGESITERLEQIVETTQRFNRRALLVTEFEFGDTGEPLCRNLTDAG
jgi:hypothetical protein